MGIRSIVRDAAYFAAGAGVVVALAITPAEAKRQPKYDMYQRHVLLVVASQYNTVGGRNKNIKWLDSLSDQDRADVLRVDNEIVELCERFHTKADLPNACGI